MKSEDSVNVSKNSSQKKWHVKKIRINYLQVGQFRVRMFERVR
jgi:hypothetical protein